MFTIKNKWKPLKKLYGESLKQVVVGPFPHNFCTFYQALK